MIERSKAIDIARQYVASLRSTESLVVVEPATIDRAWGWVFFYDSADHASGPTAGPLAGNGPIAILREDASVRVLPTWRSVDESIATIDREYLHK
jgi:hypothetical protein